MSKEQANNLKLKDYASYRDRLFSHVSAWPLHSRVHRLHRGQNQWLKRDDELAALCGGAKRRKFSSLLPALRKASIDEVILWGGAQSNHLVTALSHLREEGFICHVFCRETNHNQINGNRLLLDLLVAADEIHWVEKDALESAAEAFARQRREMGAKVFVLPEGASHPWAIPGAATLGFDILENEIEAGVCWRHVWLDAGTGLTAQAVIALWSLLGVEKSVHVVGMAGDEETFRAGVQQALDVLRSLLDCDQHEKTPRLMWYAPSTARSFGAINQKVRGEIARVAREEGVFLDPLYGAKLFLTQAEHPTTEPTLLVHSGVGGGLFSLM